MILTNLDQAQGPDDMDLPGLALHPLKGKRKGTWAVKVSGIGGSLSALPIGTPIKSVTRTIIDEVFSMAMHDPAHPGEILRELVIVPLGLSVTEAARHLAVSRKTLSKVLNGRGAVTPEMALRLEMTFGKPNAAHWLRLQNAYDLWHVRNRSENLRVTPVQRQASL